MRRDLKKYLMVMAKILESIYEKRAKKLLEVNKLNKLRHLTHFGCFFNYGMERACNVPRLFQENSPTFLVFTILPLSATSIHILTFAKKWQQKLPSGIADLS